MVSPSAAMNEVSPLSWNKESNLYDDGTGKKEAGLPAGNYFDQHFAVPVVEQLFTERRANIERSQ
jgi:hypothetical protein